MSKEYTIYGTPSCSYCKAAMRLLDKEGIPYNYLDARESEFFQEEFVKKKGVRTVPQIYEVTYEPFKEEHVGGYEQLIERVI